MGIILEEGQQNKQPVNPILIRIGGENGDSEVVYPITMTSNVMVSQQSMMTPLTDWMEQVYKEIMGIKNGILIPKVFIKQIKLESKTNKILINDQFYGLEFEGWYKDEAFLIKDNQLLISGTDYYTSSEGELRCKDSNGWNAATTFLLIVIHYEKPRSENEPM